MENGKPDKSKRMKRDALKSFLEASSTPVPENNSETVDSSRIVN
jgi:hypothetical protein